VPRAYRGLGIDLSKATSLIVDANDDRASKEAAAGHLRFARTVRVSIEGNADLARGCSPPATTRSAIVEREEAKE
jgi:hypothetical protein